MRDGPIGEDAAAAAAGDAKFFWIDVAALEQFVDSDHQIAVIIAWVVVLNNVAEFLAVAG